VDRRHIPPIEVDAVNDEHHDSQPSDVTPPVDSDVAASTWSTPVPPVAPTPPAPETASAPDLPVTAPEPMTTEPTPEPATPVSPWAPPAPAATDPFARPGTTATGAPPVTPPPVPPAPPTAQMPPSPPQPTPPVAVPAPGGGGRGPSWRQFVVGVVVGALVGGGTAAGVALATNDDSSGSTRTVVVGASSKPVRNTSVIGRAKDVQTVLAKVNDAVVAVQTGAAVDSGLFSGESDGSSGGEGTGFVISADGVIVTNNHVVEDANGRIEVEFADGTKQAAELLGRAPEYDLAVLKVDGENLPTVKLGSSDSLQVGDSVIAVGNALALQGGLSVTEGIISGKGRVVPEDETGAVLYDMLQTDAAINPGNSGGPLVNAAGEVVGINTALAGGSQNVGFAISIDSAKNVIESLRVGKSVRVAFLGVETTDVTPAVAKSLDLSTKNGAVVRRVTSGAGAEQAGMKADDVIVAIGGRTVSSPQDVGAEIRRYAPGDDVEVIVERDGAQVTLHVQLGARPDSVG
jgi:S1-C subfamily serine protease